MGQKDFSRPVKEFSSQIDTIVLLDHTIEEALENIRHKQLSNKIIYFYVVDRDNILKGVVPTRKLLLSDPKTKISDIIQTSVIRLNSEQTLQDAMEVFARHRLLAIPLVDNEGHLMGSIDVQACMEESFDVADSRHRSDIFQWIGYSMEDGKKISPLRGYRLRMPWLFCNMFAGLLCAVISRWHEAVLAKVLLLAMFIPLVLTLSESVSMQSMTQSLQFMRGGNTNKNHLYKKVFNEWQQVILVAISSGLIIGLLSLFWGDGLGPSITICLGIMISVTISAAFGILLPIVLHKTRLDPKIASGPIVLMLADSLTTLIYLSLASWWLL